MKILTAEQIREWDAFTIKNEPIASIDLMERASKAFTDIFIQKFTSQNKIVVVCGTGNNGGDGLAIARMLFGQKYNVEVFVINSGGQTSQDFATNKDRLKGLIPPNTIEKNIDIPDFGKFDVIIDGIFGSGLSRPIEKGIYKEVIDAINNSKAIKVAIDIPSGLFADRHTSGGAIVEADYTITFQAPKLVFLLAEAHRYVGEWTVADIGLDPNFLKDKQGAISTIDEKLIAGVYKERKNFTHKGDYGKCLLICGNYGKMGAAVLAASAALRAGAGLLTIHAPRLGYTILQSTVPEAMVSPDDDEKVFSSPPKLESYDVIGIGPGLGTDELTLTAMAELLSHWDKSMVIDADGLNILAKNHHLLDMVPENSILTPHPREFERLAGETSNEFERLERLKEYAIKQKIYVLLKGHRTAIATPDGKLYFNTTGNPGMATGGTGDVLTGIITALLGQKYNPEEAILLGCWLHGHAGDLAAEDIGMESLIASDVVKYISKAFATLAGLKRHDISGDK